MPDEALDQQISAYPQDAIFLLCITMRSKVYRYDAGFSDDTKMDSPISHLQ